MTTVIRVLGTATPSRDWLHASTTTTSEVIGGELIDWAVVERAANGVLADPEQATKEERYAAARLLGLRRPELGPSEIARRAGTYTRQVERWRTAGWPLVRPMGPVERQVRNATRRTGATT